MRYIKKFEEINQNQPEVGNYVICDSTNFLSFVDIIKDNIGKLIRIEQVKNNADLYFIIYDSIEGDIQFWKQEILYWSKNKEELEAVLDAKKYNL